MATFVEIQNKVKTRLNKGNVSPIDNKIGEIVNLAIQFFSKNLYYFTKGYASFNLVPEVEELSANTLYPTNVFHIDSMSVEDGSYKYPVEKVSDEDYDDRYGFSQPSSARPCIYTEQDKKILLKPKPNKAYKIYLRYYKSYPDLVNDTDTNDFLQEAEELIIQKALHSVYIDFRIEPTLAAIAEQGWQKIHNDLIQATNVKNSTGQVKARSLTLDTGKYYNRYNRY